jgi:hypothetical protein
VALDPNRLFNLLARMFVRSAADAGIDAAARGGKPVSEMTPEERAQAKAARDIARRFRQTMRLGRRFFR